MSLLKQRWHLPPLPLSRLEFLYIDHWYAEQVTAQLDGGDAESTELQPVGLNLPVLKVLGAKWLVQMSE